MATKEPINDPMLDPITGEFRVIAPGHTFKSVTEKLSGIVLTSQTPLGWFGGFLLAGGGATLLLSLSPGFSCAAPGSGESRSRWPGASPSSTLCGGSVSATPER